MIILGIINFFLGFFKLILTPIGAGLSAAGINSLISNFNELVNKFVELYLSEGVKLAAYFFNWPMVKPIFALWLSLIGLVKLYNVYRAIRTQTLGR